MQPYRVLIVDDQTEVRRVLRAALETLSIPIQITDVPSGEEALLVISRHPVDVMIADVRLPGISGLELVARARLRNPQLHLVLITGLTDEAVRRQVEAARAEAFFFKPIEMGDFLARMGELLETRAAVGQPAPEVTASPPPAPLSSGSRQETARPAPPDRPLDAGVFRPAEDKTPREKIQQCMAELRLALNAGQVVLLNQRCEALAYDGPAPADTTEWQAACEAAACAASPAAGLKAVVFFMGASQDYLAVRVTPEAVLLAVAGRGAWKAMPFEAPLQALLAAHGDILSAGLAGGRIPTGKTGPLNSALEDEGQFPDLEALFARLESGPMEAVDVDAFWESAAEDHSKQVGGSGAIPFDEAQRLGLAPEDD